jgi:hypothetical protein
MSHIIPQPDWGIFAPSVTDEEIYEDEEED